MDNYGDWLASNGVGIGSPDIKLTSPSLLDVVYPLYIEHHQMIPTGPDIQRGNYEKLTVSELLDQAIKLTNPWYIFWLKREPYFSNEVLPITAKRPLPAVADYYD